MTSGMVRSRRTRNVVVGLISVSAVAACLWGTVFLYIRTLGEGSLPPDSRIPAVPAGATVVSKEQACGSGGCWWQLTVEPPAGQSPEELARAMGLAESQTKSPTLFDPGSVYIVTRVRDDRLIMNVGYQ
ncbi:hypothetical protein [Actinoplanes sp. NPDC020271]|uniref:hypothetical protein n=1 Tax=Actinoplanes sp. NPDC020271 TaxID=3363896 RepID=UPI0037BCEF7D